MKIKEEQVFYKGGSAALLVMTPFQLLCAREAVKEFQFAEYKYVFILPPNPSKRNEQMIQMANNWGIEFDQYDASSITLSDFLNNKGIFDFCSRKKKYDRIFSGDYWSPECRMLAQKYAKENAIVSFVDDGTASIIVLSGNFFCSPQSDLWVDIIKWYHYRCTYNELKIIDDKLKKNKIFVTKSMFSVYSDVKPTKFLTRQNSFQMLLSDMIQIKDEEDAVYFIGSPSEDFCSMFGIDMDYLNEIIYTQLYNIRKQYSNKKIVYIPHPRDTNQSILKYCTELNIEYKSLSSTAEDYIRNHNKNVVAVYGFGSSTLINLKRMFPLMLVVDIVIDNPRKKQTSRMTNIINDYYKQSGIELISILIPDSNNKIKPITVKQNFVELFNYLIKGLFK